MRSPCILAALGLFVLLTGCPAPKAPEASVSAPAEQPQATPSSNAPPLPSEKFVGAWSVVDANGQKFDIVLFPNGQAVSTRVKGTSGELGEKGFWRTNARGATVFFSDGGTDHLISQGEGFRHEVDPASVATGAVAESSATRVETGKDGFVGIWRLNKEPDGSFLMIVLQSSGRALSNVNGEGKWELTAEGARCTWPDGWHDLIFRSASGFQKRSWVGPEQNTTPPDLSDATRVGEARFAITP